MSVLGLQPLDQGATSIAPVEGVGQTDLVRSTFRLEQGTAAVDDSNSDTAGAKVNAEHQRIMAHDLSLEAAS